MVIQQNITLKARARGAHLITEEITRQLPSLPNCGVLHVFIKHTSAGLTINENADPDVVRDFTMEINKIVPWEDGYRHFEGNSAAHLKSSMIGFSEQILIEDGKLLLGVWQGIYFVEFDGPRHRHLYVKIMED